MKEKILRQLSPQYPWEDLLQVFPELGSTNDLLKSLAKAGAPEGTAILAQRQTNGHGRMGRSFHSPEGQGVYLSLLLRPDCVPVELMHLTCATAVAMCEAVEQVAGFRPGIKWTNDLVFQKKKLGGILTELGLGADGKVSYAIIGIGINCAQKPEDFPEELQDMAGSLSMAAGRPVSQEVLAAAMLESLHRMSQALLTDREGILRQYRTDCVTIGQEVSILRGDEVRHGKALDVDDAGALVVRFPDGHSEAVNSGEVSVRGMYHYL